MQVEGEYGQYRGSSHAHHDNAFATLAEQPPPVQQTPRRKWIERGKRLRSQIASVSKRSIPTKNFIFPSLLRSEDDTSGVTPSHSSSVTDTLAMPLTSRSDTVTMGVQEMQRVISGITSNRAHVDPSACVIALNPILYTAEGRKSLSLEQVEKVLVLIDLFDWVAISLYHYTFHMRTEHAVFQALKSRGIPLNKGYILWTLRQLCACQEVLPKSYILPVDFKPSDPHYAAGGFADIWKGTYNGGEVAFKSIRGSTGSDNLARLRRKASYNTFL